MTKEKSAETMTMHDHAVAWYEEQGKEIPPFDSMEWQIMYEDWIEWAFYVPK